MSCHSGFWSCAGFGVTESTQSCERGAGLCQGLPELHIRVHLQQLSGALQSPVPARRPTSELHWYISQVLPRLVPPAAQVLAHAGQPLNDALMNSLYQLKNYPLIEVRKRHRQRRCSARVQTASEVLLYFCGCTSRCTSSFVFTELSADSWHPHGTLSEGTSVSQGCHRHSSLEGCSCWAHICQQERTVAKKISKLFAVSLLSV